MKFFKGNIVSFHRLIVLILLFLTCHVTLSNAQSDTQSFAKENEFQLAPPQMEAGKIFFKDQTKLILTLGYPKAEIRFTKNGEEPDLDSPIYSEPIAISKTSTIKAKAFHPSVKSSTTVEAQFHKVKLRPPIKKLKMLRQPHEKYRGEGLDALSDHEKGSLFFKDGKWIGFDGGEVGFEIEYYLKLKINSIKISALHDPGSWIFLPKEIEVLTSKNGKKYRTVGIVRNEAEEEESKTGFVFYTVPVEMKKAKYMKVIVRSMSKIPDWHPGKGTKPWLFLDELMIE